MANPINSLTANITATDAAGAVPVNRSAGAINFNPTANVVGDLTVNQQLVAGANTINMPVVNAYNLYIKNTHATNTIIVSLNFNGAPAVAIGTLLPGGVLVFWNATNTVAGSVTGILMTASGAGTSVEYFIGG